MNIRHCNVCSQFKSVVIGEQKVSFDNRNYYILFTAAFRTSTIDTGVTDAAIVRAFTEYNNEVDIYHNAYGQGLEYGGDYYPTTELERLAILQAITEVYVTASGLIRIKDKMQCFPLNL